MIKKITSVPIYFHKGDVTHEAEVEKLKQFTFEDGKITDGIGLCFDTNKVGIVFWKSIPTDQDKNAGMWIYQGHIESKDLADFHQVFAKMRDFFNLQHAFRQEDDKRDPHEPMMARMIDDKYRRKFTQMMRTGLKINMMFRKAWFKTDRHIIKDEYTGITSAEDAPARPSEIVVKPAAKQ